MSIKIDLKIFIFLFIFVLTRQVKIYTFLMTFALIHELGHLFAGLILGFKPKTLKIMPYGFSISFNVPYKNYNQKVYNANILALKKMIIALAGPLTNLIIIIITFLIFKAPNDISFIKNTELIIYSNILIFVFNLLPIYPLDGGRILKQTVHLAKGLKNSYTYTYLISNITIIILTALASIGILIYKNIAILIIIMYLWFITIQQNKYYKNKIKIINMIC